MHLQCWSTVDIYIYFFLNSYSSGFILNSSNWTNSSRSTYSSRLLSAEVHTLVYPQPFMEEQTCRENLYIALDSSGSEGMTAPSCLLRMPYDCSIKPSSAFCFVCLTLLCSFAFVFALFFSKSLPTASRVSVWLWTMALLPCTCSLQIIHWNIQTNLSALFLESRQRLLFHFPQWLSFLTCGDNFF